MNATSNLFIGFLKAKWVGAYRRSLNKSVPRSVEYLTDSEWDTFHEQHFQPLLTTWAITDENCIKAMRSMCYKGFSPDSNDENVIRNYFREQGILCLHIKLELPSDIKITNNEINK